MKSLNFISTFILIYIINILTINFNLNAKEICQNKQVPGLITAGIMRDLNSNNLNNLNNFIEDKPENKECYKEIALSLAAYKNKENIVKELINSGTNANALNHTGNTPLMWVAKSGHLKIVNDLIKAGADVNIQSQNYKDTALMYALSNFKPDNNNYLKILQDLVKAGADYISLENSYGYTALTLAISRQNKDTIKEWLKFSSTKNIENALKIAKKEGRSEIVTLLEDIIKAKSSKSSSKPIRV